MQKTSVIPSREENIEENIEEKVDTMIDDVIEDFPEYPVFRKTVSMKRASYVIVLGNMMNAHTSSTNNIAKVLALMTRELAPESNVMIGNHSVLIEIPMIEGDFDWFQSNVERKADLIGTRTMKEAEARAKRIAEIYNSLVAPYEETKFGYKVVEGYIRQYGMQYDKKE